MDYLSVLKEKLRNEIREVITVVEQLVGDDIFPSIHKTGNKLSKSGLLRSKDAIEAYYQILKKYNLR